MMGTAIDTNEIKTGNKTFLQRCIALWTTLMTVGVTDKLTDWEKKRSRLLNGICSFMTA